MSPIVLEPLLLLFLLATAAVTALPRPETLHMGS
jgi:hypothetical protein